MLAAVRTALGDDGRSRWPLSRRLLSRWPLSRWALSRSPFPLRVCIASFQEIERHGLISFLESWIVGCTRERHANLCLMPIVGMR